ncbi:FAD/NAD(P)-binding domain-containing protein [Violaceomyces palustris]|uniref:FAD/NAD(P)-binding domain-containing protein n=1 Tax=Violaceomyces palustris TaxID=1673888 RepID=A0ACD0P1U2_9BASI|nr:FAD/NAD(P)-binding domain-containing protein [Violaceomyces palustris]
MEQAQAHKLRSASISTSPTTDPSASTQTKNVVVLGGSYGGMHAATVLAQRLPPSHRVILIERNSHFNHLYVFPRFSVLPGHEHKAFIPYTSIFKEAPVRPKTVKPSNGSSPKKSHDRLHSVKGAGYATPRMSSRQNTREARTATQATQSSRDGALGMGGSVLQESSPLKSKSPRQAEAGDQSSSSSEDGRASSHSSSLAPPSSSRGRPTNNGTEGGNRIPDRSRSNRNSSNATVGSSSADSEYSAENASSSTDASLASSYTSDGAHMQQAATEINKPSQVPPAGDSSIEAAITKDAIDGSARVEETLGRPPIEVADLEEAVQKGMDLGADTDEYADMEDPSSQVAEGFEDSSPHVVLQATVTDITRTHITVTPADSSTDLASIGKRKKSLWSIDSVTIPYSHLIYALGSHLPDPLRTEARTKREGISWMREIQERVKASNEIVLVGGGALGVEFATDIASVYPEKKVTLIHSRKQLLPNFDERIHTVAYARLMELGVNVVLGERLALTEGCPRGSVVKDSKAEKPSPNAITDPHQQPAVCLPGDAKGEGVQAHQEGMCVGSGRKLVRTTGGKSFECDLLLLCTGQQPNSSLMAKLSPSSVHPSTRLVRVHPTLQVAVPDPRDAAQQPFDAKPPCGDCDCFLDKKAQGSELANDEKGHLRVHGRESEHEQGRIPNAYAIGDCADAFGALNAGYQAWGMADIAVENILRDIESSSNNRGSSRPSSPKLTEMVEFKPAVNMLKLSLGLGKMVFQGAPVQPAKEGERLEEDEATRKYVQGKIVGKAEITVKDDPDDLGVQGVWTFMANADTENMYL